MYDMGKPAAEEEKKNWQQTRRVSNLEEALSDASKLSDASADSYLTMTALQRIIAYTPSRQISFLRQEWDIVSPFGQATASWCEKSKGLAVMAYVQIPNAHLPGYSIEKIKKGKYYFITIQPHIQNLIHFTSRRKYNIIVLGKFH
jgi:hypothetical protein